jgi:uncharacterized protein
VPAPRWRSSVPRAQVARLLGYDPEENVFTGSGSEATTSLSKDLCPHVRSWPAGHLEHTAPFTATGSRADVDAPGVKQLPPISRNVRRSTEVNRDLLSERDEHLEHGGRVPCVARNSRVRCWAGVPFEPVRQLLLVYQQHGGPWDWSKGLRDQELFDEHARFLDGLVDEGYIVLGGPLDERDVLLVVQSETEASVRSRFAADPWIQNGMLTITAIRPWTIFLEGRL